jgi:hypothetical protein
MLEKGRDEVVGRSLRRRNRGLARIALTASALALCACEAIVGADFDKAVLDTRASSSGAGSGDQCTPGDQQACYAGPEATKGVGICTAGVRTCGDNARWGSCGGEVLPATEDMSQRGDENCDGISAECRWQDRFGDDAQQRARQIAVNTAGELFVTGDFQGTLNFGKDNHTGRVYLAKFDSIGDIAWSKSFSAGAQSTSTGVAADPDGGAVMVGSVGAKESTDLGGGALTAGKYARAFVARFDGAGDPAWSYLFDDTTVDKSSLQTAFGVAADPSGRIAVAGGCIGSIGHGTQQVNCQKDWWDGFVALLDAAGNARWIRSFGGLAFEAMQGLAFDADGNVIATGIIQDVVQFDTKQAGEKDQLTAVVVKLSEQDGKVLWAKGLGAIPTIPPPRYVKPAVDPQGDIIVATGLSGPFSFGGACPTVHGVDGTDMDVTVVKFDPAEGECLWVRHFPAPGDQNAASVAVDGKGNIVLGGSMFGAVNFGFGEHKLRGKEDAFLLKLAPSGLPMWSRSFGNIKGDAGASAQINGLGVDPMGNIYLAGDFDSAVDFCDDGLPMQSMGSTDIYIAKYAP